MMRKRLIDLLQENGISVVNCTVDERYSNDLERRVAIANSANGVTVFTTSTSKAKDVARRVIEKVSSSCGYTNRGLKHEEFYVIRHTKAPAFLVECCFVTNQGDCNKFNA